MLDVLLESASRSTGAGPRGAVTSVVAHAAVIAGAAMATMQPRLPPRMIAEEPIPILTFPDSRPKSRTAPQPNATAGPAMRQQTVPDIDVPVITTVAAATPASPDRNAFDPNRLWAGERLDPVSMASGAGSSIYTTDRVERQVSPSEHNGRPGYPTGLRAAGVEGDVILRCVVDTTGRVEAASITVVAATHQQFADAAVGWLVKTRYAPAQIGGRAVRQLVEQRVGFSLRR